MRPHRRQPFTGYAGRDRTPAWAAFRGESTGIRGLRFSGLRQEWDLVWERNSINQRRSNRTNHFHDAGCRIPRWRYSDLSPKSDWSAFWIEPEPFVGAQSALRGCDRRMWKQPVGEAPVRRSKSRAIASSVKEALPKGPGKQ